MFSSIPINRNLSELKKTWKAKVFERMIVAIGTISREKLYKRM